MFCNLKIEIVPLAANLMDFLDSWEKLATFLYVINLLLSLLFTSFSKTLPTTKRRLTRRLFLAVHLFPNIINYWCLQWDLRTIWKTALLQIYIEVTEKVLSVTVNKKVKLLYKKSIMLEQCVPDSAWPEADLGLLQHPRWSSFW